MQHNLNKADKYFLEIIQDIKTNGEFHQDRTSIGTKRVFGRMFKFKPEDNVAITLKPVAFKNVIRELLFFLGGDCHLDRLRELGGTAISWWQDFSLEDGTIGPLYPKQWRNLEVDKTTRQAICIEKRVCIDNNYTLPYLNNREESIDDIIYSSNHNGNFIIVEKIKQSSKKQDVYTIQFLHTGYKKYNVLKSSILKGNIKDPYFPRIYNVGYLGKEKLENALEKNLYIVWVNMLSRCYNKKDKKYNIYGGNNAFVDSRWFNFNNFLQDAKTLPGWFNKKKYLNKYQLDKDYYGSNGYSKDTCIWLLNTDNSIYTSNCKPFKAKNISTNEIFLEVSVREFAKKYNLTHQYCQQCLNNKRKTTKGFKFEYLNYDEKKYVYRYPLPIDQIQDCINLIKKDPGSRRICFTGWNPQDLYKQNLFACHSSFVQFAILNNQLCMSTIQRSADAGIGIIHNWISYRVLQMLIAHECNLELGEMTYFVNDLHIYNNHMDKLDNLGSESFSYPQIEINYRDNINDYKVEDFKLLNYKAGPKIKLEMAV